MVGNWQALFPLHLRSLCALLVYHHSALHHRVSPYLQVADTPPQPTSCTLPLPYWLTNTSTAPMSTLNLPSGTTPAVSKFSLACLLCLAARRLAASADEKVAWLASSNSDFEQNELSPYHFSDSLILTPAFHCASALTVKPRAAACLLLTVSVLLLLIISCAAAAADCLLYCCCCTVLLVCCC